jgi:hypothetical protein
MQAAADDSDEEEHEHAPRKKKRASSIPASPALPPSVVVRGSDAEERLLAIRIEETAQRSAAARATTGQALLDAIKRTTETKRSLMGQADDEDVARLVEACNKELERLYQAFDTLK